MGILSRKMRMPTLHESYMMESSSNQQRLNHSAIEPDTKMNVGRLRLSSYAPKRSKIVIDRPLLGVNYALMPGSPEDADTMIDPRVVEEPTIDQKSRSELFSHADSERQEANDFTAQVHEHQESGVLNINTTGKLGQPVIETS